jgi:hypothetical protein
VYNLLSKDGEPLFKDWYFAIEPKPSRKCIVLSKVDGKSCSNLASIDTGEFFSDIPLNFDLKHNISRIEKNGKVNFINREGETLFSQWADNASRIDNRGYVTLTYGNDSCLFRVVNGQIMAVEEEGNTIIPSDFTECNNNQINLFDHKLIYTYIGYQQGRSEHTTTYRQKVTIITSDGRKAEQMYTQRGDESCKWMMYEVYEKLCKQLGVTPAEME